MAVLRHYAISFFFFFHIFIAAITPPLALSAISPILRLGIDISYSLLADIGHRCHIDAYIAAGHYCCHWLRQILAS